MKVGIIGGGQLGRMMALAAYPLGIETICLEKNAQQSPAGQVTATLEGEYTDRSQIGELIRQVDVVTYEFENINAPALQPFVDQIPIYPPLKAVTIAQDRLAEKTFFQQCQIPVAAFIPVQSEHDLKRAIEAIGLPGVLKTCRMGYDGKGQFVLRQTTDIKLAWQQLQGQALIYEQFISLEREVSLLAVRSSQGKIVFYPLTENVHRNGILQYSIAPYENIVLQQQAEHYLQRLLMELNYVGVLAIEFFVKENQLIANEMAPRVHNSGHWTIEGAATSQFENHLRAVCNLPLGETTARGFSAMINIIGDMPALSTLLAIPNAHVHLYGKSPRPQRKLGHVTICAENREQLQQQMQLFMQFKNSD